MTEAERAAKLHTSDFKGVRGILKALQSEAGVSSSYLSISHVAV